MEKDRRGIQSIEVGGSLLQTLVRHGAPMMLKDLAGEAGMPAAKAHPYLVSFGKLGLIEQDAGSGLYKLGPFALQMGLVALHELDAVKIATERAAALSLDIQQNVALAVWGNHGPTVVRIQECNRVVHINMRTGTVMSLLDSATGKVFAAYLPPRLTEEMIASEMAARQAGIEEQAAFQSALQRVRERGMARAVGYPLPGINAFSVPVFDHAGQLALVMTTLGPAATFASDWNGVIAQRLRSTAADISAQIGYRG
ncbi:IclR family transcriptional regulator [Vogesella sp. EB]|uniref:IclR family transcriptional regulator n=1 Tax=unclassified Vogesella TaxID=2684990 RepID=UPI00064D13F6|nr:MULTISPECIES: IclR family transcriptional regulator [unclassified Vogesella]KMJ53273.1 IclR family transcriptional regulator [Vogesella sp. EB]